MNALSLFTTTHTLHIAFKSWVMNFSHPLMKYGAILLNSLPHSSFDGKITDEPWFTCYHSFPANVLFRMSFISKDETLDSWLLHVYKTYRLLYIVVKHEQSLNTHFLKKILHTKIAYFEFLKFTKQNFTEWTLKSVCQQSTSQQWKLGPSRKKT